MQNSENLEKTRLWARNGCTVRGFGRQKGEGWLFNGILAWGRLDPEVLISMVESETKKNKISAGKKKLKNAVGGGSPMMGGDLRGGPPEVS